MADSPTHARTLRPRDRRPDAESPAPPVTSPTREAPARERVRVLIVEDEPLVAMMLIDIVEDAGFAAIGPAATADEALRLAESERPAVAIVDVTIRGSRGGVETGTLLAERHGIALIFMSGHGDVGARPEVRALAPSAVLQKPCAPNQIVNALRAAAEARQVDR